MLGLKFTRIGLWWIFIVGFALSPRCQAQSFTEISCTVSEVPDGSLNLFFFEHRLTGPLGPIPETNAYQGPPVAMTNRGTNLAFQTLVQNANIGIYEVSFTPSWDSLGETVTLFDGNVSTNLYFELNPAFLTQPQSQSLFVGANASFSARAIHSTGYQWQMNGTNLTEDGHFSGVTNSTLNITGVTLNDGGTYTVIAEHPANPELSSGAVLAMFKLIQLTVANTAPSGFVRILAGNADQSPFEASRASNVLFYHTTNLSLSFTNWSLCPNSILLTNGVLQCDFAIEGIGRGFWQVVEQP